MYSLTNQDRAYFMMVSRGNAHHHINVTPETAQPQVTIIQVQQPQVPVIYQTDYSSCTCHQDTSSSTSRDNIAYQISLVSSGIQGGFEGIADIIRATKGLPRVSAETTVSTPASQAANTPASSSAGSAEMDALQKQHEEIKVKLAEIEQELKDYKAAKTTSTPASNTPASETEINTASKTEAPKADNESQDNTSEVAKKWKTVDVGYSSAQADAYSSALRAGDTEKINKYKNQLADVTAKITSGLAEIEKALKATDITAADKATLEAAKKKLNEFKAEIDEALATKAPEKADSTPAEAPVTPTPSVSETPTTTPTSPARPQTISEAKQAAAAAQEIYNNERTIGRQIDAIEAYNDWGRAVLNDPNATMDEIDEIRKRLEVVASCNKSPYVQYLLKSDSSKTNVADMPTEDLIKALDNRLNQVWMSYRDKSGSSSSVDLSYSTLYNV